MSKSSKDSSKKDSKKAARQAAAERTLQLQTLLKSLKQNPNLLEPFPAFTSYNRNDISLKIEYFTAETLPSSLLTWTFNLTKRNVQSFYESCPKWGWSDSKKWRELEDSDARFIVASSLTDTTVTDTTATPVGFVHLRFEMEGDDPVLYVYEIHVDESVQGKGLGKFLMQLTELIARHAGLARVMLTVFTENTAANALYTKLGYVLDEDSPGMVEPEGNHGYEILTKTFTHRK